MLSNDRDLLDLISEICQDDEDSPQRRRALERLCLAIDKMPGIFRSSHPDYLDAYNRTLEWVCHNICKFTPRNPERAIEQFVIWFNGYLYWRNRDLYVKDGDRDKKQIHPHPEDDFDPIANLPDPISVTTLEAEIAREQEQRRQRQGQAVQVYIQNDPDGRLQRLHLRDNPQGNCHLLAKLLLLEDPPQKISQIARQLQIKDQTLYSHWKRKCLPCLQEIARRYNPPTP